MSSTLIYQYLDETSITITVPSGYSSNVQVYAWGAGGGAGYNSSAGGGGGFVQGIINASSGDTIQISVGGTGGRGPRDSRGVGGNGNNPVIALFGGATGYSSPYPGSDDQYYGAGGGGGAATSVLVNGIPMIVAAGGGGGGGGTAYQTGTPGTAGGVATAAATTPRGGESTDGYSVGGAGGAGYPYGGAGGQTVGDDAGAATGGYGGQNYANATVFTSTLTAGSGITPGGLTNAFYPSSNRGYAGYSGAVILVFTKIFTSHIKQSGSWKLINRAWAKTSTSTRSVTRVVPPTTITYGISGTSSFVVPLGVFSIDASVTGGGGGGGGGGYGTGGEQSGSGGGGGGGYTTRSDIAVQPGETLTVVVGAGGLAGASHYSRSYAGSGGNGGTSTLSLGASIYLTAAGGNGGTGGLEGQAVAGGAGYNNGGSGAAVSGTVRAGGNGGASTLRSGAIGVASTSVAGENGSLGSGGAGGPASDSPDGANNGGRGGTGYITLSYSAPPITEVVAVGGWKEIVQGWIKQNGNWKLIESSNPLIPVVNGRAPPDYTTINIVIAADTNNYNLIDYLPGYGYYPGRSLINLIVNANVVVGSAVAGTPALNITRLTTGDIVNVINNGSILGAGGRGGAAGSYSSVTTSGYYVNVQSCFLPGTLVSTPNGYVAIETIQVGDLVYAYNIGPEFNNSVALEPKTVTKTYTHTWEEANQVTPLLVITHSQGELIVTPEHELLCLDKVDPNSDYPGFVRADALAVGDIIYAEDGSELTVTNISNGPEHYEYVYNIEVDDFHTYVADSVRVHNGQTNPAPVGRYVQGTTTITSNPGKPGETGGTAVYTTYNITLANNGVIAGGGGGGGGGGGPTGGQGGGGAGSVAGSGANNGTLTAGGAGAGIGGQGGARGTAGVAGTNENNAGGVGGPAGVAIVGYDKVTLNVEGTILGPRNVG